MKTICGDDSGENNDEDVTGSDDNYDHRYHKN